MRSLRLSEFTLAALLLAVAVVAAQPAQIVRFDLVLPNGATRSWRSPTESGRSWCWATSCRSGSYLRSTEKGWKWSL